MLEHRKFLTVVLEHRKPLAFVLEQLQLDIDFSELSLEVQGGVDYFRIVEGTTINCFVSFFSLSLFTYPLQVDSEYYIRT